MRHQRVEILGPYLLADPLDGALPEVLRAAVVDAAAAPFDAAQHPTVIVRRLPSWLMRDDDDRQVFVEEIRARERAALPHTARVLDAILDGPSPALVLEDLDGVDVDRALASPTLEGKGAPLGLALYAGLCVAEAVTQLYITRVLPFASGILGAQLSARRVLFTSNERDPVTYLGPVSSFRALPRSNVIERIMLEARYVHPNAHELDEDAQAGDVYALAVLLHELIEGRAPDGGDVEARRQIGRSGYRYVPTVKGVPRPVVRFIEDAMAVEPRDRPGLDHAYEMLRNVCVDVTGNQVPALGAGIGHALAQASTRAERERAWLRGIVEKRRVRARQTPRYPETSNVVRLPGVVEAPPPPPAIEAPDGMVLVPSGPFLFGPEVVERSLDGFFIDRFPVTVRAFRRFVDETGYAWAYAHRQYYGEAQDWPVTFVTHADARAYAAWAGKRLPGEEEWEKAARGTAGRPYPYGRSYREPLSPPSHRGMWEMRQLEPVGRRSPQGDSPFGVGSLGQVWEWTETGAPEATGYVVRGGPWRNLQEPALMTNASFETQAAPDVGFRCAMDLARRR